MSQASYTKFTSFDQPDGAGIRAQVFVTEMTAPLKEVRRGDSVTTVVVDHEAAGMQYPFTAYATNESPWIDELESLAGTGQLVSLRAETKRKPKDRAKKPISRRLALRASEVVPHDEVLPDMNSNSIKALVALNGVFGPEALTNPDEDRKWRDIGQENVPAYIDINETPQHAAAGAAGITQPAVAVDATQIAAAMMAANAAAARTVLETMASEGGHDLFRVNAVFAQAILDPAADRSALERLADTATAVKGQVRSSRLRELQPWIAFDAHGRRNFASYEYAGACYTLGWAETFVRTPGRVGAADDEAGLKKQARFIADGVLQIADAAQEGLYRQAHGREVSADRNAASHRQAREAAQRCLERRWDELAPALHDNSDEWKQLADVIIAEATESLVTASTLEIPEERTWGSVPVNTENAPTGDPVVEDTAGDLPGPVLESVADTAPPAPSTPATPTSVLPVPAWEAPELGPWTVDEGGAKPDPKDTSGWTTVLAMANLPLDDSTVSDFLISAFGTDTITEVAAPRVSALMEYLRSQASDAQTGVAALQALLGVRAAA